MSLLALYQHFKFYSWVPGPPNILAIHPYRSLPREWANAAFLPIQLLYSCVSPKLAYLPLLQVLSSLGLFFLPSTTPWTSFSLSSFSINSPFPIPVPIPCCSVSLQLLCQNPLQRLHHLHRFQVHPFFRGVAFDPELLQKQPVNFVMETQAAQPSPSESMLFEDFDCNLESYLAYPGLAWAPLL